MMLVWSSYRWLEGQLALLFRSLSIFEKSDVLLERLRYHEIRERNPTMYPHRWDFGWH
jgi:hypothetical protein